MEVLVAAVLRGCAFWAGFWLVVLEVGLFGFVPCLACVVGLSGGLSCFACVTGEFES